MNARLLTVQFAPCCVGQQTYKSLGSWTKRHSWEAVDLHAILPLTIRLVSELIKVSPFSSCCHRPPSPTFFRSSLCKPFNTVQPYRGVNNENRNTFFPPLHFFQDNWPFVGELWQITAPCVCPYERGDSRTQ